MNEQITSNKIESAIKNLPTEKSQGPGGFTGEFYQTFKEEINQSFQKVEEAGTLPNSLYEAGIFLGLKAEKTTPRKLHLDIHDEYRCKTPQQNTSGLNQISR